MQRQVWASTVLWMLFQILEDTEAGERYIELLPHLYEGGAVYTRLPWNHISNHRQFRGWVWIGKQLFFLVIDPLVSSTWLVKCPSGASNYSLPLPILSTLDQDDLVARNEKSGHFSDKNFPPMAIFNRYMVLPSHIGSQFIVRSEHLEYCVDFSPALQWPDLLKLGQGSRQRFSGKIWETGK